MWEPKAQPLPDELQPDQPVACSQSLEQREEAEPQYSPPDAAEERSCAALAVACAQRPVAVCSRRR